ncbi:MAG: hypothetical protein ACREM3_16820 [Candidatus Rokuibacteriota bacterium]
MTGTRAFVGHAATALEQTTGFSRSERHAIIDAVSEQAAAGRAADQTYSTVLRGVGARDFEWPEFDRWRAIFAGGGAFPPLWDGLEETPHRGAAEPVRQTYRERKLYLLIDWLHGLVATRAEVHAALTRYAGQGRNAAIARQNGRITCPACGPRDHQRVAYDSHNVPPLHPGCRCVIVARPTTPSTVAPFTA